MPDLLPMSAMPDYHLRSAIAYGPFHANGVWRTSIRWARERYAHKVALRDPSLPKGNRLHAEAQVEILGMAIKGNLMSLAIARRDEREARAELERRSRRAAA